MRKVVFSLGVILPIVLAAAMAAPSANAYSLPRCEPVYPPDPTFPLPYIPCPDPVDPTLPPLTPIPRGGVVLGDAHP
jgi:hypothetical protein